MSVHVCVCVCVDVELRENKKNKNRAQIKKNNVGRINLFTLIEICFSNIIFELFAISKFYFHLRGICNSKA